MHASRPFKPIRPGDPLVGRECYVCQELFKVGDAPALLPVLQDPVNADLAIAEPIHWRCSGDPMVGAWPEAEAYDRWVEFIEKKRADA
jgi:hypothetical protein